VTGNNIYKFYKIKDSGIQAQHQNMAKKDVKISTHYTCHAWMQDEKIIVCTDQGEIMLLESSGEFKLMLTDSPGEGFYIETIVAYGKGFIIAGMNGQIIIYERLEDLKTHYRRSATLPSNSESKADKEFAQLLAGIMSTKIRSLALSNTEDTLFFTTDN
jgi:hypothetical protein